MKNQPESSVSRCPPSVLFAHSPHNGLANLDNIQFYQPPSTADLPGENGMTADTLDDDFPPLEELPRGAREMPEPQRGGSSGEDMMVAGSEGNFALSVPENTDTNPDDDTVPPAKKLRALDTPPKHLTPPPDFEYPVFRYPRGWVLKHRDRRASSNPGEAIGSQENPFMIPDNDTDTDTSDDYTSEDGDGSQGSFSSPPTSVARSAAGCPTLNKGKGSSSNTFLRRYTTLLSPTPQTQLCDSIDDGRKANRPSPRSGKEKGNQWSNTDTETYADADDDDDDEEEPTGGTEKLKTRPPRRMKKRHLPIAREEPPVKRRTKRRPFSAPLLSDEETETGDESDVSKYVP